MIYPASKTMYAPLWRELRAGGIPIDASWLDRPNEAAWPSSSVLWDTLIREVSASSALVFYGAPGDEHKGAIAEVGAALASGVPVFTCGAPDWSLFSHPLCEAHPTLKSAVKAAHAADILRRERGDRGPR